MTTAKAPPQNEVSEAEYERALEECMGWCKNCEAFTTDSVEPDAERRRCAVCGECTVFGAEWALLLGLIELPK